MEILQNFVAFSEYMNFKGVDPKLCHAWKPHIKFLDLIYTNYTHITMKQQQNSPNFICVEICTEKVKKKKETCDDCARVPLLDLLKNYYWMAILNEFEIHSLNKVHITHDLYTFYPLFEDNVFSRSFFQKILPLCMVSIQERFLIKSGFDGLRMIYKNSHYWTWGNDLILSI